MQVIELPHRWLAQALLSTFCFFAFIRFICVYLCSSVLTLELAAGDGKPEE